MGKGGKQAGRSVEHGLGKRLSLREYIPSLLLEYMGMYGL